MALSRVASRDLVRSDDHSLTEKYIPLVKFSLLKSDGSGDKLLLSDGSGDELQLYLPDPS